MRRRHVLIPLAVLTALSAATLPSEAAGTGKASFHPPSRADNPALNKSVNEPATAIDTRSTRYVAYQLGSQLSTTDDGGRTWRYRGGANLLRNNLTGCTSQRDIGDVDVFSDNKGGVYLTDLQAVTGTADNGIQAVVAKSTDGFASYSGTCATHQPASVDRQWIASYVGPGKTTSQADIYLSYHDFGPNFISLNASHDGGRTWLNPVPVIDNPDAVNASGCDTVPAGTAVDPRNGWVYVGWLSGNDPGSNATTGCNYTQGTVFNKFWVAVSKDKGRTFTTSLAFAGPGPTAAEPSDMSEIFGSLELDRTGNVYISFPAYLNSRFEIFYAYSPPANGAGVTAFRRPVKVSTAAASTAYFARLATGSTGRIGLIYLGSPVRNVVVTPQNKIRYDGSDPTKPNCSPEVTDPGNHGARFLGKPCQLPATAPWYLYYAQSLDATSATPTFATTRLRADAVHTGDICTLGIFCLGGDNRDIADTNDVRIDHSGGVQVAYTYEPPDGSRTEIDFQCQSGGPSLLAERRVLDCQR